MPYLSIEAFQGGVDRRRPIYAAPPGTLWECINAHVTKGGDVECRKRFIEIGAFSGNTFGLFAKRLSLYTFGSDPSADVTLPGTVIYQRLQHPAGIPMTEFVDADLFDGKIYAIARYADNSVQHFYDGVLVTAWSNGIVRPDMGTLSGMAASLAAEIDASANYIASSVAEIITVTAATPGVPFSVATIAEDGGGVDDQAIVNAVVTPNVVAVDGIAASFSFSVAGGAAAGAMSSVRVNGTETMTGGPVSWATSNTTFAAAIAAALTASAAYTATSVGPTVTVTAVALGAASNGQQVEVTTTGTARAGIQSAAGTTTIGEMSGGVTAVAAVAQVNTLTLSGTFQPGDRFGIKLTSGTTTLTPEYFGNYAQPFGEARTVKTHKNKMYVGAGPFIFFSRVNDPTAWNSDEDPGAGFINGSTHCGGSEQVGSLETYQGRLGAFARIAIQLWTMQADDDANALDQVIENVGTRCPRSTCEFGGNDLFYLDDVGIRSLRARDASNNAFASDVGVAIDPLMEEWLESVSDADIVGAAGIVEPVDGRFWMAVGSRIFVYSYFPTVKISAWSWYELDFTPRFLAKTGKQVWVRGDDENLYLYGGYSGREYATVDTPEFDVTVQMPFTWAGKIGDFKGFTSMDIAGTGEWQGRWLMNPNVLAEYVNVGLLEGVTYSDSIAAGVGHATHVAPRLVNNTGGYCVLSKVTVYYAGEDRRGP